ncbi:YafY family protein [Actibacterium sp. 188UL27-1]|uniref:helix-turn-helix transcriptional regulator n=1 Tax=Actibacterium sp. 188UL27-1 TaxID=2786961 RepID=UPI00195B2519|nr:YafY family protein [Actibacterium sp. 188UL27-1]MBM7066974.1 YafY family transcriptional regulator [Actibacterium sp. 188UL27-1]
MRRADRLFQIVQYLRGGRLVRAQDLAERLEVSQRTIYRDIADLQASGVPVDGEAGVGYIMQGGFDLPPLMFNRDEIVALVAGARLLRAWGGEAMAAAAMEALVKIDAVLPEAERDRAAAVQVHAFAPEMTDPLRRQLDRIEIAVDKRRCLTFVYADKAAQHTQRTVRPLGLWFWGKVWTLVAWCELREDFRMFRVDRMTDTCAGAGYKAEPGRDLRTFYALMRQRSLEAGCTAPGQMRAQAREHADL